MDFINELIESYAKDHTSPESDVLKELNRETYAKILMPRMLSGHLQGRILSMLSKLIHPELVLEIGTFTGYSAICLAEGLKENGKLHTIDINDELKPMVKNYLERSGKSNSIICHYGNALEIIPELVEQFDMVFIDADKINYMKYYELIFDKVKTGGLILADNVLWSGKVIEKNDRHDADTKALMKFNEMIMKDNRVEKILLPVRDGLYLIRKK